MAIWKEMSYYREKRRYRYREYEPDVFELEERSWEEEQQIKSRRLEETTEESKMEEYVNEQC